MISPLKDDMSEIKLTLHSGTDEYICMCAKMSTMTTYEGMTSEEKQLSIDKLIDYLYTHEHTSPLEFARYDFYIVAPLFVVQQLLRHRTCKFSQASERYSVLKPQYYIPSFDQIQGQSKIKRQCRDGNTLDMDTKFGFCLDLIDIQHEVNKFKLKYEGKVANELVRLGTLSNQYTKLMVSFDLNNLLKFIENRNHPDAQFEIRQYAIEMLNFIEIYNPSVYKSFKKHLTNTDL